MNAPKPRSKHQATDDALDWWHRRCAALNASPRDKDLLGELEVEGHHLMGRLRESGPIQVPQTPESLAAELVQLVEAPEPETLEDARSLLVWTRNVARHALRLLPSLDVRHMCKPRRKRPSASGAALYVPHMTEESKPPRP